MKEMSSEHALKCKLDEAILSLPKIEFDTNEFVSLIDKHALLFKEVNAARVSTDTSQYDSCMKLFMCDASLFVLLIENDCLSTKLTLKRSFDRSSLPKISGKLKNVQYKAKYRNSICVFMKLLLQAVDIFDGDSEVKQDMAHIINLASGYNEYSVHTSESSLNAESINRKLPDEHCVVSDNESMRKEETLSEEKPRDGNEISTDSVTQNSNAVSWTHLNRDVSYADQRSCFVCKTDDTSKGELHCCAKKYRPTKKCNTHFHVICLQEYNAGRFSAEYLKALVGQYQCPLHHCDTCWMDRYKSSAIITISSIIECVGCFRGYHLECLPAGLEIIDDGKDKKVMCHNHYNPKLVKPCTRIPFCIECEERDHDLVHCSKCIRAFHRDCLTVRVFKGDRFEQNETVCESCIYGESVKAGQHVIARYMNGLYPGIAVHISEYPKHCIPSDKYGKYYGKPGFVPIRWGGCHNLFTMTPAHFIIPMFDGSHSLCRPSNKDKDFSSYWKNAEGNLETLKPDVNIVGEHYTKIKTSVYHQDTRQPRLVPNPVDVYLCDCPNDDENRCGPGSRCSARSCQQECPLMCEKNGRCNNRSVANKQINSKMEMRSAHGKGDGVFATGLIKKGEFVAEYAGELISNEEQQRRIDLTAKAQNDEEKHYMMKLDSTRIIDCKFKGNIARFINHSCDPNCIVETVEIEVFSNSKTVKYDKRVRIVAVRDILPEEELSFNYDMDEFSAGCPLPECLCNAPNCTGKLGRTDSKKNTSTRKQAKFSGKGKENIQLDRIVEGDVEKSQIDQKEVHPNQNFIKENESTKKHVFGSSTKASKRKLSETVDEQTNNAVMENMDSSLVPITNTILRRTNRIRKVK